jgi:hypothetical protein
VGYTAAMRMRQESIELVFNQALTARVYVEAGAGSRKQQFADVITLGPTIDDFAELSWTLSALPEGKLVSIELNSSRQTFPRPVFYTILVHRYSISTSLAQLEWLAVDSVYSACCSGWDPDFSACTWCVMHDWSSRPRSHAWLRMTRGRPVWGRRAPRPADTHMWDATIWRSVFNACEHAPHISMRASTIRPLCSCVHPCRLKSAIKTAGIHEFFCNLPSSLCSADGAVLKLSLTDATCRSGLLSSIALLSRLQWLDLSSSYIGADVADVAAALPPGLSWLFMSASSLNGSLPCSLVSRGLRTIALRGNQLTGAVPACFADSSSLAELHLAGNQLTGAVVGVCVCVCARARVCVHAHRGGGGGGGAALGPDTTPVRLAPPPVGSRPPKQAASARGAAWAKGLVACAVVHPPALGVVGVRARLRAAPRTIRGGAPNAPACGCAPPSPPNPLQACRQTGRAQAACACCTCPPTWRCRAR